MERICQFFRGDLFRMLDALFSEAGSGFNDGSNLSSNAAASSNAVTELSYNIRHKYPKRLVTYDAEEINELRLIRVSDLTQSVMDKLTDCCQENQQESNNQCKESKTNSGCQQKTAKKPKSAESGNKACRKQEDSKGKRKAKSSTSTIRKSKCSKIEKPKTQKQVKKVCRKGKEAKGIREAVSKLCQVKEPKSELSAKSSAPKKAASAAGQKSSSCCKREAAGTCKEEPRSFIDISDSLKPFRTAEKLTKQQLEQLECCSKELHKKQVACSGEQAKGETAMPADWNALKAMQKFCFYLQALTGHKLRRTPYENFRDIFLRTYKQQFPAANTRQLHAVVRHNWRCLESKERMPFNLQALLYAVAVGSVDPCDHAAVRLLLSRWR
ncbi:hypothetical protein KR222_009444 [Zaprionus bogoriensis]|nr:hypothetical protein KR222_009444 [Zaprionus bogoriensis]